MKEIVVTEPYKVSLLDAEIPKIEEGEVLLKTQIAGVCGSDISLYKGAMQGYATYPRVPGHEVSATVVEIADKSSELKEGDLVTVNPYFNCGKCYSCRRGLVNCCTNNRTMGLPHDGVFREYFKVPAERAYKVNGLDPIEAALIEPFCIGYHAAKIANPQPGERALVMGAGTIGIFTMLALKMFSTEVYVANRSPERLEKAKEFGADDVFTYNEDENAFQEKVDEITDGDKFDIIIEAVGNPAVFKKCVEAAAHRARIVEVGITPLEANIPLSTLQKKELQIFGSRNAVREDFTEIIEFIRSGKFKIKDMVTTSYTKDQAETLFDQIIQQKNALKSIIDFR